MGVSTVLREIAAGLTAAGRPVRIVHLPDSRDDALAADDDTVLVVDDAHLGDERQRYGLRDRALRVPVVFGVRSGATDDALAWLWHSGAVDHHELAPLGHVEVAELAAGLVRGDVHRTLVDDLMRNSGGRPGFVVDELASLRDDAQLVSGTGLLRSSPTAAVGRRLMTRARSLLAALPPELAAGLELLAVAGHLPTAALADLDVDLPELRLRCLAGVRDDVGGSFVTVDPPVLERAIRATLPPARLRELATRVHRHAAPLLLPYDRVRVALAVGGDVGDAIGSDELTQGARAAMSAHQPGEALALAARAAAIGAAGPAGRSGDAVRRRPARRGRSTVRRACSTTPMPIRCCVRSPDPSTACCSCGISPVPTRRWRCRTSSPQPRRARRSTRWVVCTSPPRSSTGAGRSSRWSPSKGPIGRRSTRR